VEKEDKDEEEEKEDASMDIVVDGLSITLAGEHADKVRALLKELRATAAPVVGSSIDHNSSASKRKRPYSESFVPGPPQIVLTLNEGETEEDIKAKFEAFREKQAEFEAFLEDQRIKRLKTT
jgi:hypothetical protein